MNERQWTEGINEGGEGYNPYTPKERPVPRIWQLRGRRDSLMSIMAGTSTADGRYAKLEAELAEVKAEIAKEANK